MKAFKGLFSCQMLTDEDLKFFPPSQQVLAEEKRLEDRRQCTLLKYSNGAVFPEKMNKEAQKRIREEQIPPEEEEIDIYPLGKKRSKKELLVI